MASLAMAAPLYRSSSLGPCRPSGGLRCSGALRDRDALVGVEPHVDSIAGRRSERRVGTCEKLEVAELHLEVEVFAEEHLLVDHASEDRLSVRDRFLVGEMNVL